MSTEPSDGSDLHEQLAELQQSVAAMASQRPPRRPGVAGLLVVAALLGAAWFVDLGGVRTAIRAWGDDPQMASGPAGAVSKLVEPTGDSDPRPSATEASSLIQAGAQLARVEAERDALRIRVEELAAAVAADAQRRAEAVDDVVLQTTSWRPNAMSCSARTCACATSCSRRSSAWRP